MGVLPSRSASGRGPRVVRHRRRHARGARSVQVAERERGRAATRVSTTGILLAGGASRRLPPNKLLEPIEGEPMFWRALRALSSSCDEVVVMVGTSQKEPPLPPLRVPARLARDRAVAGPLAAVADALAITTADVALVVAGDTTEIPGE